MIRVFSSTPEQVPHNVAQAVEAARLADELMISGRRFFRKTLVLVAADDRYVDHDCGETAAALHKELDADKSRIEVHEIKRGDLFCGLLNAGVAKLNRDRCDYVFIMSHGSRSYLVPEVMVQFTKAFERGAKVAGLILPAIAKSVKKGRIPNTFGMWEIEALLTVGGFNLVAAQSKKEQDTSTYLRGWHEQKGPTFYSAAGVEEIVPLVHLVDYFGECIAPIPAPEGGVWEEPSDSGGRKRSEVKVDTKEPRQDHHLYGLGVDSSFLEGGVMKVYRTHPSFDDDSLESR